VTLCVVISFVLAVGEMVRAASWDVPGDFATIQDAIDSTLVIDGDRIMVGAGRHAGASVTKAVEIKGEGGAIIETGPLLTTYMPCGSIVLNIGFSFEGAGAGGGIGVLVAESSGGEVRDNVVSHNKVLGTLEVAECDEGGYAGSGVVLYADWRYGRNGAQSISDNRIVKNKISLVSNNPDVVDVNAIELTEAENPGGIVVSDNAVGFNDLRGTASQLLFSHAGLDDPTNKISRNLGENRGHGQHPSVFGPGGN
jgi:hypothetical protein